MRRVFFAFIVDASLYSVWQSSFLENTSGARFRYVPFFGLAAYLLAPLMPGKEQQQEE